MRTDTSMVGPFFIKQTEESTEITLLMERNPVVDFYVDLLKLNQTILDRILGIILL
jgi:hypothetical protein